MDEVTVRVLRAVACYARLRILSHLFAGKERTLSDLARDLRARRDLVCLHLARLASAGLILRRRSGARCYCVARSPYGETTLSGQVMAWLRDALHATAPAAQGSSTRRRENTSAAPEAHRAIFEAATAFTNTRRIRILRRLATGKAATVAALGRELKMSERATRRHVGKLVRRGYILECPEGQVAAYRLAPSPKTPLHARLLEAVSRHWGE